MHSPIRTYQLADDRLRVVVDPAIGGKIRSLISQASSQEYLYQDPRTAFSGPGYSDHDITGIDECFPTVAPCRYSDGRWQGLSLGDHGWLWDRSWEVESANGSVAAYLELANIPLRFQRTCRLVAPGVLQLEYAIENRSDAPFEYLYANHMLLHADSSTRIYYPWEMRRAYVYVSNDVPGVKDREWINWPAAPEMGITEPFDPTRGRLIKVFSPRLRRGAVAIAHGEQRELLRIDFSVEQLPHLGILLAQGFSATQRDWQGVFVGLEATTGIGDDLTGCRDTNTSVQIEPGEIRRFQIRLSLIEQQT